VKFIAGSGKDDYSSSTQKQSIETIATSRNTSLKHFKLNKTLIENAIKSPSLVGMGSTALRYSDGNDSTNCHACLSTRVSSSKINIFSDCNINEIHLNIFPPTAKYVKETKSVYINNSLPEETIPNSFLSINVHERKNQKVINGLEKGEGKRKTSLNNFSHISFKRCDSILHISIGNSSKISKRHKRHSWHLANLWKFSHKRKSSSQSKCFFSPKLNKDGIHRLSDRSLNLFNDELMITVNKQNYGDADGLPSTSSVTTAHNDCYHRFTKERDLSESLLNGSDGLEIGANELDYYMSEIKQREMR
jgi:hypothetical protein